MFYFQHSLPTIRPGPLAFLSLSFFLIVNLQPSQKATRPTNLPSLFPNFLLKPNTGPKRPSLPLLSNSFSLLFLFQEKPKTGPLWPQKPNSPPPLFLSPPIPYVSPSRVVGGRCRARLHALSHANAMCHRRSFSPFPLLLSPLIKLSLSILSMSLLHLRFSDADCRRPCARAACHFRPPLLACPPFSLSCSFISPSFFLFEQQQDSPPSSPMAPRYPSTFPKGSTLPLYLLPFAVSGRRPCWHCHRPLAPLSASPSSSSRAATVATAFVSAIR